MGNILRNRQSESDDNGEFSCEICFEPAAKRFRNGGRCCHPFCSECVCNYIRVKVGGGAAMIKCPAVGCGNSIDAAACAGIVDRELFVRWCDALREEAIAAAERCYCPNGKCGELILNECGGARGKSRCPSCRVRFCFQCRSVWHAGFGCGEAVDGGDVAFGRLVERRKWRRCPRCGHFVEQVGGCDMMECRCGTLFCYKCGNRDGCSCDILFLW